MRPEDLDPVDVGHHLALENRFNGATIQPYSVAQHSVLMAHILVPELMKPRSLDQRQKAYRLLSSEQRVLIGECLFHDGSEAYLKDVIRPLKLLDEFAGYRLVEDRLMLVLAERFGLRPGFHNLPHIKQADAHLLALEKLALTRKVAWESWEIDEDGDLRPTLPEGLCPTLPKIHIKPWSWRKARDLWLDLYLVFERRIGV